MDLVEYDQAAGLSAQKRIRVLHLARIGWPLEIQIDRLVPEFVHQRSRECGLPNLPWTEEYHRRLDGQPVAHDGEEMALDHMQIINLIIDLHNPSILGESFSLVRSDFWEAPGGAPACALPAICQCVSKYKTYAS